MIHVNLETELLRQNRKLATPLELLLIKEYERNTNLVGNDALQRVGISTLETANVIKKKVDSRADETVSFKKERVFHISQIEAICNKYYLRFLPANYYKGSIDHELPTKITNFEAAYKVKCGTGNTLIMAPKESFKLQEQPKDPLFFYQINDDYYYLIHKWGNDLSVFRQIKALYSQPLACWATWQILTLALLYLCFNVEMPERILTAVGTGACFFISTLIFLVHYPLSWYKPNEFTSAYK